MKKRGSRKMYRWLFIFILLFLSLNLFEADAQSLNEAAQSITKDIIATLPKDSKSIAIIPPRNTAEKENRGFEIRITEGITNRIKPMLPEGCRLSDRFNIRRIAEDISLYGQGKEIDELLKSAGVDINITGSYTVLKESGRVEINYRAVKVENGDVLATAKVVYIPLSELSETSDRILILVRPKGIISAEGGRKAVEQTSARTKQILADNKLNIIEYSQKIASEDFLSIARKSGANIVVLLDVEGEKRYTDFGNIIADVKIAASVYKDGKIASSLNENMKVGAVNDEDDPLLQAVDIIIEKIGAKLIETLKTK
jgi:TolB-like protein